MFIERHNLNHTSDIYNVIVNKNRKQDQKSIRVCIKIHLHLEIPVLPDHIACTLPLLPV